MSTIVKAADAAQFLSLVPHLLGFRPSRSLVVIPFQATRTCGALRVDLPSPAEADAFASTVIGMACRVDGVDGLTVVVYTDAAFGPPLPQAPLARALKDRADACGLQMIEMLCVTPEGWARFDDPRAHRHPHPDPGPRDLCGLDVPEPSETIDSGAELPRVPDAAAQTLASAYAQLELAVASMVTTAGDERIDPRALAATEPLDDIPLFFEERLSGAERVDPHRDAALLWCLTRPAVRDIGLSVWCQGLAAGDAAFDAQLRWADGEEYPAHLARHMWGEGVRPEPERLESALTLARRIAATAPEGLRPGPLATCAWLSWALGRSTHADRYAAAAISIDPEHGLAEIVRAIVAAGHLPDWAFRTR